MDYELIFALGILVFCAIVLAIGIEHYVADRWLGKDSLLARWMRAFERKHPKLCDREDSFYCFFKKDSFIGRGH